MYVIVLKSLPISREAQAHDRQNVNSVQVSNTEETFITVTQTCYLQKAAPCPAHHCPEHVLPLRSQLQRSFSRNEWTLYRLLLQTWPFCSCGNQSYNITRVRQWNTSGRFRETNAVNVTFRATRSTTNG